MNLSLSVIEESEAERLVLVTTIGLLESLKNGSLTIDDCNNYLFSPYTVNELEKKEMDEKIIEIVKLGCELEDFESMFPERLLNEVEELKNQALELLKVTKNPQNPYKVRKWMDDGVSDA